MCEVRRLCDVVGEVRDIGLSVWMGDGCLVFTKKNWEEVTQKEWFALRYVAGYLHYDDEIELRGALWGEEFTLKLRKLPPEDEGHVPFIDAWSMDMSYGRISIQTSMTSSNPFEIPSGGETGFYFISGFSFETSKRASE